MCPCVAAICAVCLGQVVSPRDVLETRVPVPENKLPEQGLRRCQLRDEVAASGGGVLGEAAF